LESTDKLVDDFQKTKTENEETEEEAENPFRNDQEKKIAGFLQNFHESNFGEAINTFGELMGWTPRQPARPKSAGVIHSETFPSHPGRRNRLVQVRTRIKYTLNKEISIQMRSTMRKNALKISS